MELDQLLNIAAMAANAALAAKREDVPDQQTLPAQAADEAWRQIIKRLKKEGA